MLDAGGWDEASPSGKELATIVRLRVRAVHEQLSSAAAQLTVLAIAHAHLQLPLVATSSWLQ